jgi:coenzyme F420-reducing hydrogenase alpha subunit
MDKPSKTAASLVLAFGLLAGCSQPKPRPVDMGAAVQGPLTKADHEALATRYEQAAQYAEAKVEEQKKLRDQWQEHRYLDPKQAENMQEHYDALIYHYQQIAKSNLKLAEMHREMAASAP